MAIIKCNKSIYRTHFVFTSRHRQQRFVLASLKFCNYLNGISKAYAQSKVFKAVLSVVGSGSTEIDTRTTCIYVPIRFFATFT